MHDSTWEFCATVTETRQLVSVAQQIGVTLDMTSVRIDPSSPHGPCYEALTHDDGAEIDGYVVTISCTAPEEALERLHDEIDATIKGCLVRPGR